jgi:muconate cycloisomerase
MVDKNYNVKFDKTLVIKDISLMTMKIPLKKPIKMSGITVSYAENLFIKIIDETGLFGWGEASSAPTMTGEFAEGMFAAASFLKPMLIGKKISCLKDLKKLKKLPIYENKGTLSAFEIALIDLISKLNNVSIYKLLGNPVRKKIPIIQMVAGQNLDEEIDNLQYAMSKGFTRFKIKIGSTGNYINDLNRCKNIIKSSNNTCIFSADANEGYDYEDALAFSKNAKGVGLTFFEQPISAKNLIEMSDITSNSSVPVCSDEGVHSINDLNYIVNNKSSNGVSLKTIKLGGMLEVLKCANYAFLNKLHVNLAGKVAETSISSLAIAHLASCIPQMDWDLSITNQYLEEDPVVNPLLIKNGYIDIENSIGLGTEIDEIVANKYIKLFE